MVVRFSNVFTWLGGETHDDVDVLCHIEIGIFRYFYTLKTLSIFHETLFLIEQRHCN